MRRLLLLLPLLAACTSYQAAKPLEVVPLPAPERERFEVWTHGKGYQLHALHLEGDSLVGVPWWKDPGCDSCRVVMPKAEVDSVRFRQFDGNETGALAAGTILPIVALPGLLLVVLWMFGLGPTD